MPPYGNFTYILRMKPIFLLITVILCLVTVSAWLPISFQQKSYGKSMELRMGAVKAKVKRRVRGKRIPDPQKNIPRKIKRSLKTIESTEFEQLMHDPRLDGILIELFQTFFFSKHQIIGFLKNTTIGIKTTLFKRLEQKARKFNITIPAGFGKRPPLIKIPFWKSVEANGNYTVRIIYILSRRKTYYQLFFLVIPTSYK